ncbi:hypothetical protein ACFLZB_01615, partial [Nanoarchaeota archaeon]
ILLREKNKKNLVRKIDQIKNKGFLVLVKAGEDDLNRFVLEKTRADIIFDLELLPRKDAMHYRRSGLDQVKCKIAAEKKKTIGFNFWSLVQESKFLGRLKQNLKFCSKYNVAYLLGSFADKPELMRSPNELQSFLRSLNQPIKKSI